MRSIMRNEPHRQWLDRRPLSVRHDNRRRPTLLRVRVRVLCACINTTVLFGLVLGIVHRRRWRRSWMIMRVFSSLLLRVERLLRSLLLLLRIERRLLRSLLLLRVERLLLSLWIHRLAINGHGLHRHHRDRHRSRNSNRLLDDER